jgi:hypothetical protein
VKTDATRAADAASPPSGRHVARGVDRGFRDGVVYCLKVFVGVRVVLALLAVASVAVLPHIPVGGFALSDRIGTLPGPVGVPGWPAPEITAGWHNLFTAWERFDALWFLRIAAHGYGSHDGSAAFYPLFPLAVRGVSFLIGGHELAAGLIVSNAAALAALVALYGLTREELSEETARASVLFAAIFPTAFFLVSPYSESLFFLLVLLALWAARRGRWVGAALAGALAALTRNLGVLLVVPLAVEALHQAMESKPFRWPVRGLAASLGPMAGAAAYALYWEWRITDWLAPLHQQNGWQRELTNPASTVLQGTKDAFRYVGLYPGGYHALDWLVAIPVLALALYAAVTFRPSFVAYLATSIAAPLAFTYSGRPFMSFPRFGLVLFPVFWGLARLTERSQLRRELAIAASAALLGLLLVLFVNWLYVF